MRLKIVLKNVPNLSIDDCVDLDIDNPNVLIVKHPEYTTGSKRVKTLMIPWHTVIKIEKFD